MSEKKSRKLPVVAPIEKKRERRDLDPLHGTTAISNILSNPQNTFVRLLENITREDEPEIIEDAAIALNCVVNKKPTKDDQQKINSVSKFAVGECFNPYFIVALVQKEMGLEKDESKKGPKRPRTAYNFYTSEMNRQQKRDRQETANNWNEMDEQEKQHYEKLADKDKMRYKKELAASGIVLQQPQRKTLRTKQDAITIAFKKIAQVFLDFLQTIDTVEEAVHAGVHLFVASKFFFAHFPGMIFSFPNFNSDQIDVKNNVEGYVDSIVLKATFPDTSANMLIRMSCTLLRALAFMKQERKEKLLAIERARVEAEQLRELDRLLELNRQLKKRKTLAINKG